jgi:hypothetical protein
MTEQVDVLEGGAWTTPLFNREQERIGPTVWWEVTTPTDGCTFHTVGYAISQELAILFAAAPKMLKALRHCLTRLENHQDEPGKPWIVDIMHEDLKEECRLAVAAAEGRKDVKTAEEMMRETMSQAKAVVEEIAAGTAKQKSQAAQRPDPVRQKDLLCLSLLYMGLVSTMRHLAMKQKQEQDPLRLMVLRMLHSYGQDEMVQLEQSLQETGKGHADDVAHVTAVIDSVFEDRPEVLA